MTEPITLYERIGGDPTIRRIVESFYPRVQKDPLLSPLFPEDIRPTMEKQRRFLTQFFGGPALYTELYGHPRMRARHLPFPITPERAEAWLHNMAAALDDAGITGPIREEMWSRLCFTAAHMVNRPNADERDTN
ncbi:globin domain-containing protein [Salinithrix halophila]|uniref:Globin n=1 Tax=Salinithrix halophila TaxID=1485204 RepID=A0ABV8JH39_9BACL